MKLFVLLLISTLSLCLIRIESASATTPVQEERHAFNEAVNFELPKDAVIIQGNLKALYIKTNDVIAARNCSVHILKQIVVEQNLTTNTITTEKLEIAALSARRLESVDKKQPVTILSNVQVNGNIIFSKPNDDKTKNNNQPNLATAFVETMSVVSKMDPQTQDALAFISQAKLVVHDDFTGNISGWMVGDGTTAESHLHHCGNHDYFLTLSCKTKPSGIVYKVFDNLPPHKQIELSARVHFIDMWRGGSAFAVVDGAIVWLDSHGLSDDDDDETGNSAPSLNLCGADVGQDRLSVPVKVIIPHQNPRVNVTFGTTIFHFKDSLEGGKHKCAASLGVDDVAIYAH